jgi:hypothetical protein
MPAFSAIQKMTRIDTLSEDTAAQPFPRPIILAGWETAPGFEFERMVVDQIWPAINLCLQRDHAYVGIEGGL